MTTESESQILPSFSSNQIAWADAQVMINAYMANNKHLKVKLPTGQFETLKGLRISSDDLKSIINRTDGNEVNDVFIAFGVKQSELGSAPDQQTFTTIFIGIGDDSTNPNGKLLTDIVMDFCEPCPQKCPTGI